MPPQSYDQICDRMDDLSIRNLRLCNDLIRSKMDLDHRLRDGWLSMAKTRFVAGYHRFGLINFTDQEPIIDRDAEDQADVLPTFVVDMERRSPSKSRDKKSTVDQSPESIPIKVSIRISRGDDQKSDGSIDDDEKSKKADMERALLKKFGGGLAPGSLKQMQRTFATSTELLCEIKSIEFELESIVDEYRGLATLKQKLAVEG